MSAPFGHISPRPRVAGRRLLVAAAFALIAIASIAAAQGTDSRQPAVAGALFSFVDDMVVLSPGSTTGQGDLVIHAAPKTPGDKPKVADFGPPGTKAELGLVRVLGNPIAHEWVVPVKISDLPQNTPQQLRHLQVAFDGTAESHLYTVKNTYADKFTWSVLSLGGPLAWSEETPIVVTVIVGPVPATHVLAHAELSDEADAARFGAGDLQICTMIQRHCSPTTTLAPNQPHRLFLRPPDGWRPRPGKYSGTIELVASEDKGAASQVTVYVTDVCHKIWGFVAIVVGVGLSYVVTLGIRNPLARAQLLLPAADLRNRFSALVKPLKAYTLPKPTQEDTRARINDWIARLSPGALQREGLIPGPLATGASPTNDQAYQHLLDRAATWLVDLDRIINAGLAPVHEASEGLTESATEIVRKGVQTAWAAIDGLSLRTGLGMSPAADAPSLAVLESDIAAALEAMRGIVAGAEPADSAASASLPQLELERVRFQITSLSLATWVVAALLTIAIGSYVMVLSHLDFGRLNDFVLCVLWGLGLPIAGSALAQANPASIASSVGVLLPKATA